MVTMNNFQSESSDDFNHPRSNLMDEFIMFGDSITQYAWQKGGLGACLADRYQRKLDLVNRGYSGYNTIWALEVAKKLFPPHPPECVYARKRIITIWLGANDSVLPNRPQHVPEHEFAEKLKDLIHIFHAHDPEAQLILITPPPISVSLRAKDLSQRFPDWKPTDMDREPGRTASFARCVINIAAEEGLPALDAWHAITRASETSEHGLADYLVDGLHLTPAGYDIVSQELMNIITTRRPDLLPENLPQPFPHWSDIDPNHPGNSFPGAIVHSEL